MKTIQPGDQHSQVLVLQKLLNKGGYFLSETGIFDPPTEESVRLFQSRNKLQADAIVGPNTWKTLFRKCYDFNLGATNYFLQKDEWMDDIELKDTIFLHHTAGGYRPDYTIDWWERDNQPGQLNRVATAFVIGGMGLDGNASYDGKIYRAFNEVYWAHHLGTKLSNNTLLNKKSIGIEICSLGPLTKENGRYWFAKKEVPASQVVELPNPWRGYKYFHFYSAAQLERTKELILSLSFLFDIPLPQRTYDAGWFSMNADAQAGKPGLWTHCHVRTDKTDCFPHPQLIEMLNSLYEASKTFRLADAFRVLRDLTQLKSNPANLESEGYSGDLQDAGIDIAAPF